MIFYALSNAAYRVSLRGPRDELESRGGGGVQTPPARRGLVVIECSFTPKFSISSTLFQPDPVPGSSLSQSDPVSKIQSVPV